MGLKKAFTDGVEAVFNALKDAVKSGQYTVIEDDGWGESNTTTTPVRVIFDQFKQEDVEFSSFYDLIQPTDVKGLIPGKDLPTVVKTSHTLLIGERTFTIVAFDTDAFGALYTMLLRDT